MKELLSITWWLHGDLPLHPAQCNVVPTGAMHFPEQRMELCSGLPTLWESIQQEQRHRFHTDCPDLLC